MGLDGVNHRRLALAVVADGDGELDMRVLFKGLEAVGLDLAEVDEQIVAALLGDEAIAFVSIEPFNCTSRHANLTFCPEGQQQAGQAIA